MWLSNAGITVLFDNTAAALDRLHGSWKYDLRTSGQENFQSVTVIQLLGHLNVSGGISDDSAVL